MNSHNRTYAQRAETLPLVSVTIPSYNAAGTIAETVDSVLAQTYQNIEIIVVDDGSTDNTHEILTRYGARVRSIRQDNSGLASARNVGCRLAQGKYIALMDADDICTPERIALQVAYMEQKPEIVMCSSDFAAFNEGGVIADSYIQNYYSQIAESPGGVAGIYTHCEQLSLNGQTVTTYSGYVYEQMAMGSFIHPPTVLIRRSILDQSGLVDEAIINCCDYDWFVRISRVGAVGYINRSLIKYRFSNSQMSGSRNHLQLVLDIVQVMEKTIYDDPSLFQRNRELFHRKLGIGYLAVANALADNQPLVAVAKLMRSILFGVMNRQTAKVIVKIFTPLWILNWRRERL